jgi:hypothetical protein
LGINCNCGYELAITITIREGIGDSFHLGIVIGE